MLLTEPQITLPIEDQILEAIISPTFGSAEHPVTPSTHQAFANPLTLAARFRISVSAVLDILANPLTRSRIAAAQELRDLDFHQREQSARDKALTALENILDTSEDPIEKRRAATTILRRHSTRNPFWPRTPGAGASTALKDADDDLDEIAPPRAPLPPPESPRWCQPARATLIRLLTRLQDNHNPEPDSGLATLFHHKPHPGLVTPDEIGDALSDYLDDPGEDAALAGFSCAILQSSDPATPASPSAPGTQRSALTEHLTLHWPDHHRTVRFHFTNAGNSNADLWKIADIDIGPEETSAPDSS